MPPEEQDGTLAIRALGKDDCVPVCELVLTLFDAFVAPRATPEGRALFVEHTTPGQLERRLAEGHRYWVALLDGVLAGVVGVGTDHHLYWLWVDASLHHRGIGRRLLEHAVAGVRAEDPGATRITVFSSGYAVPVYRRLGFRRTGPEQYRDGIPMTPMALDLMTPPA